MQYLYGKVDTKMNEVFEMVAEVLEELRSELRSLKLISEAEYQLVEKKLKKDYGVISNITA